MMFCAEGANTDVGIIFVCSIEAPVEPLEYPTHTVVSQESGHFVCSIFADATPLHIRVSHQIFIVLSIYPEPNGFRSLLEIL